MTLLQKTPVLPFPWIGILLLYKFSCQAFWMRACVVFMICMKRLHSGEGWFVGTFCAKRREQKPKKCKLMIVLCCVDERHGRLPRDSTYDVVTSWGVVK